jgi:hypothetical protein
LATEPTAEKDLRTSRWFLASIAEGELALGLWLLAGLRSRAARAAALAAFLAFFSISLSKALGGVASCGCFGKVPIHPWYTAAFDFAALVALFLWQPTGAEGQPVRPWGVRSAGTVLLAVSLGVPGGILMGHYPPGGLGREGEFEGSGPSVLLQPDGWVGKRLPLLQYVNIGEQLGRGEWVVVLYHHGCPKCAEIIPEYEARARALGGHANGPRIALIEIPPYGEPTWGPVSPSSACASGRLSDVKDWFITTPAILDLREGVVVAARTGQDQVAGSD